MMQGKVGSVLHGCVTPARMHTRVHHCKCSACVCLVCLSCSVHSVDNDAKEGGECVAWLCYSCTNAYPHPSLQVLCVCELGVSELQCTRAGYDARGGEEYVAWLCNSCMTVYRRTSSQEKKSPTKSRGVHAGCSPP
eukprot:1162024-Pelagomonas_calceolata.AAC.15